MKLSEHMWGTGRPRLRANLVSGAHSVERLVEIQWARIRIFDTRKSRYRLVL